LAKEDDHICYTLSRKISSHLSNRELTVCCSIGQNPTSGTLGVPRRKEIYAICQKYDVIIIEDDPYWYLQYPSTQQEPVPKPAKSSGYEFLDSLMPSYLSVDVDGRVVRLDTFSKTVAPGCRLGWITAQPAVIERIMRITEATTQQPSGFVQSMIAELLIGPENKSKSPKESNGWDMSGWVRWLEGLRGEYERRMNKMCDILDQGKTQVSANRYKSSQKKELYEWAVIKNKINNDGRSSSPRYGGTISIRVKPKIPQNCPTCNSTVPRSSHVSSPSSSSTIPTTNEEPWSLLDSTEIFRFHRPTGGMFLWIEVLFDAHPLAGRVPGQRLSSALWLFWTTAPFRVIVSPGSMFSPTSEIAVEKGWRFFRLCFAAVPLEQLEGILERFCQGIQAFWEIDDKKVIDELLKDTDMLDYEELGREPGLVALTGFC
jgi:DNA-binding transcriptional MocR family regulator